MNVSLWINAKICGHDYHLDQALDETGMPDKHAVRNPICMTPDRTRMAIALSPLAATRAMYDHISRGEWDQVAAFMTEDFVIHEPLSLPYGGEWRGRDAMQRLYARVMGYWLNPVIERIGQVGDERHTVALVHLTITSPDTGVRFSQHVAEVTTFAENGLMQSMRVHYFDTGEMLRQITGAARSLDSPASAP